MLVLYDKNIFILHPVLYPYLVSVICTGKPDTGLLLYNVTVFSKGNTVLVLYGIQVILFCSQYSGVSKFFIIGGTS